MAADGLGNFIVVWNELTAQDGASCGVFGQRFSSSGIAAGERVPGQQLHDGYAVGAGGGRGRLRRLRRGLAELTGRTATAGVSSGSDSIRRAHRRGTSSRSTATRRGISCIRGWPRIAAGDFVVVWSSAPQDGSSDGMFGQRFSCLGPAARATSFRSTPTRSSARSTRPAVAADAAGRLHRHLEQQSPGRLVRRNLRAAVQLRGRRAGERLSDQRLHDRRPAESPQSPRTAPATSSWPGTVFTTAT